MGGILVVLFGTIVIVGLSSMIQLGEDLLHPIRDKLRKCTIRRVY